jgi:penicillin-binding protein 1B
VIAGTVSADTEGCFWQNLFGSGDNPPPAEGPVAAPAIPNGN